MDLSDYIDEVLEMFTPPPSERYGERLEALRRVLVAKVDEAENRGLRCVILARMPADPEKAAYGFVLTSGMDLNGALPDSTLLKRMIRGVLYGYKVGEESPMIINVEQNHLHGPRIDYISAKRDGPGSGAALPGPPA